MHIIKIENPRRPPSYVAKRGFTENIREAVVLSLYWAHSRSFGLGRFLHLDDRISIQNWES